MKTENQGANANFRQNELVYASFEHGLRVHKLYDAIMTLKRALSATETVAAPDVAGGGLQLNNEVVVAELTENKKVKAIDRGEVIYKGNVTPYIVRDKSNANETIKDYSEYLKELAENLATSCNETTAA